MPVGHNWKFDLEKTFSLDFGVQFNISIIRIEHVMHKFIAAIENTRKIRSEDLSYNRGKVEKKQREIATPNFQYIIRTRVELYYPWQKTANDRGGEVI